MLLEKELKLVPKNYYRYLWLVIGMAVFGIPMGVVFSGVMDNYGMIGLGVAVGTRLDKKASEEADNSNLQFDRLENSQRNLCLRD